MNRWPQRGQKPSGACCADGMAERIPRIVCGLAWRFASISAHHRSVRTSSDSSGAAALEPLLSIDDVAGYLGVSVTTIYDWRVAGKGPRAIKVGRHLRFAVSDLMAWVGAQRETRPGDADVPWPHAGSAADQASPRDVPAGGAGGRSARAGR